MVQTEIKQKTKLCLIAGDGELPVQLVESAIKAGVEMTCFAVTKEAYSNLKSITKTFRFSVVEIFPGLEKLKELDIQKITFIGKVPKLEFFKNLHKLDKKLLDLVMSLKDLRDDSLHNILSDFASEHGLEIVEQTKYLKHLFPNKQIFTERKPTEEELEEINFGMNLAKAMAANDVGQTVVIQNKSPLAIEAIEGTKECIKRGRKLSNGKPITVCKVSKPNQDQRFDVPTVGLGTLKEAGKSCIIALEANETFFINQKEAIKYANENNICIISC